MAYGLGIVDKYGKILEIDSLPYVYHAFIHLDGLGVGTRTLKIAPATHGRKLILAPCMGTYMYPKDSKDSSPAIHKYYKDYHQTANRGMVVDTATIDSNGNLRVVTKSANSGGLAVTNQAIFEVWAGLYG